LQEPDKSTFVVYFTVGCTEKISRQITDRMKESDRQWTVLSRKHMCILYHFAIRNREIFASVEKNYQSRLIVSCTQVFNIIIFVYEVFNPDDL
jgi:hypothetical protein